MNIDADITRFDFDYRGVNVRIAQDVDKTWVTTLRSDALPPVVVSMTQFGTLRARDLNVSIRQAKRLIDQVVQHNAQIVKLETQLAAALTKIIKDPK